MNHMLFLGLGYSAGYIATDLAANGWRISGTARTAAGAEAITRRGWHGIVFDGTGRSDEVARTFHAATHVLLSIPPDANGDAAIVHHAADLSAARQLGWIGYFSTVGVYGDEGGGWVDESARCNPTSARGKRRLQAEQAWQQLGAARGANVFILRLPGIYGPGRSAIDAVQGGTARRIIKPGQVFNRIHVADIARAVQAAIAAPDRAGVYNVTDDLPSPPQDVVTFAAGLLGVEPPPEVDFASAALSPMARSFYCESKRVSNRRMKTELGVILAYPTYREGLAAILARSDPLPSS
ncbi:MAG: SDR family oxidoreductase [Hyphomicrobiaceae bacterium]